MRGEQLFISTDLISTQKLYFCVMHKLYDLCDYDF